MERRYLKNVSPKTVLCYEHSVKAFERALDTKALIVTRITELRQRNVSAISVNTYLRCINAFLRVATCSNTASLLSRFRA